MDWEGIELVFNVVGMGTIAKQHLSNTRKSPKMAYFLGDLHQTLRIDWGQLKFYLYVVAIGTTA